MWKELVKKLFGATGRKGLEEEDWKKITYNEGQNVFRFERGEILRSTGEYKLPVQIVGKDIYIKIIVVEPDILLLLSRSSMKKAGIKMDFENVIAIIMGKR